MQIRPDRLAASSALALLAMLSGCSGGSSGAANLSPARCAATTATKFCLVSCNLGCSNTECSVSQIAQNQPITLTFSQPVDPNSVNSGTVLLRTQSGEPPIGDLLLNGNTITFQPKIEIQGGVTFFGFRANETYVLTLPAGTGGASLQSVSGEALGARVTCQLVVSRGIIDLDDRPPVPTLLSPTETTGVSRGTTIVVEFSELIDAAPFAGTGEGSPIEFSVSRAVPSGGSVVCDDLAPRVPLPGVPRVVLDPVRNKTTVSFRPSLQMPGDTCVEVRVTDRVRDLSGRAADPVLYRFVTETAPPEDVAVIEEFDGDSRLDAESSSTTWANGVAVPGRLGGSGLHGEFDPAYGTNLGSGLYQWDLDVAGGIVFPADRTLSGREERVTDGAFEFTKFHVPAGTTVRFVGTKAPRIRVRGEVLIEGTIDVSGLAQGQLATALLPNGQAGGPGGPGGGRGGNGADQSNGSSGFDGADGADVVVSATHAYAGRAAGTGGPGAPQFPADNNGVTHNYLTQCVQVPPGAGGGGYWTAGGAGHALQAPNTPPELGPDVVGGTAFQLFPLIGGVSSLDHFLVGGSGGGGGGGHIYGHRDGTPIMWKVGTGGTGGGGALAIRCGGTMVITTAQPAVAIRARGGDPFGNYQHQTQGPPGPAGGGSGGTVLLQSAKSMIAQGVIDISGGLGVWIRPGASQALRVETRGGDGAPGFVRAEVPGNPTIGLLQNVRPAADPSMVGPLLDNDDRSGFVTRWYATRQIFPPTFQRYEVEAVVDGNPVTFSDDPAHGVWAPIGAGTAIEVMFQGADVDPRDGSLVGIPTEWRSTVGAHQGQPGIAGESIDGFRFTLVFNRRAGVEIRKVSVIFRL
ncbi:MAG: Ig-like domain-containing protein [Planctomycetota bacterium]